MECNLTQELLKLTNVQKVLAYEVTDRDIRRFSQAIGAGSPKMQSDGRLIAAPLFCQTFMFEDVPVENLPMDGSPIEIHLPLPIQKTVGGQSDFNIYQDVLSGDIITVRSRLKDIVTKEGKSGILYLITVETSFHNQKNELVAAETATYVKRT